MTPAHRALMHKVLHDFYVTNDPTDTFINKIHGIYKLCGYRKVK